MKEIYKSYNAGIFSLILTGIIIIFQTIILFLTNKYLIISINIFSFILFIFNIAFYFKFMKGYIYIGNKYSKTTTKSIYSQLILIILGILVMILIIFSQVESNDIIAIILSISLLLIYILYAISKIIFGISLKDIPNKENTKKTLKIFSILEGISLISIVGLLIFPYLSLMTLIFQILFLKDTYHKSHENKIKRNRWFWITILIIYLIIIILTGYFFYDYILWLKSLL